MKRSNLGFSIMAFVGLALMVCGCPVALMASNSNGTYGFIVGALGIIVLIVAIITNRFRVFG